MGQGRIEQDQRARPNGSGAWDTEGSQSPPGRPPGMEAGLGIETLLHRREKREGPRERAAGSGRPLLFEWGLLLHHKGQENLRQ